MADIDNFPELQRRHGGQYIALQGTRIVAYGKTFRETSDAVNKMDLKDVRYQFVQPKPKPLPELEFHPKRRAS